MDEPLNYLLYHESVAQHDSHCSHHSEHRHPADRVRVQDEWRLKPNLVLSYGLRYENETIVIDKNNFAPRVAFSYDPFKTGKTVIRGGAGVFYNRALLRTIDDFTLGKQQLFFDTDTLVDPATGKLMTSAQRRVFLAANLHFPQTLTVAASLVKH